MTRIKPIPIDKAPLKVKNAFIKHVASYKDRITNTKATLGHSLIAFEVYMQWYPLYGEVQRILGHRLACLYAYSICEASNCQLCSAHFRKIMIDAGEKPENLKLSAEEQLMLDFGRAIARSQGGVSDDLFRWVSVLYEDKDLVALIAFAGQMIATNIFNNVVKTDVDAHFAPYLPLLNIKQIEHESNR